MDGTATFMSVLYVSSTLESGLKEKDEHVSSIWRPVVSIIPLNLGYTRHAQQKNELLIKVFNFGATWFYADNVRLLLSALMFVSNLDKHLLPSVASSFF